jgi:hypothetical protein
MGISVRDGREPSIDGTIDRKGKQQNKISCGRARTDDGDDGDGGRGETHNFMDSSKLMTFSTTRWTDVFAFWRTSADSRSSTVRGGEGAS